MIPKNQGPTGPRYKLICPPPLINSYGPLLGYHSNQDKIKLLAKASLGL